MLQEETTLYAEPVAHTQALLDVVANLMGDASAAAWIIERGGVWVGGVRVRDIEADVPAGNPISVRRPPAGKYAEASLSAEHVLYEDADLIVLDKPANMYVSATPWDAEGNLLTALERMLEARDGEAPRLHLMHRLDRDTSGVLLLSKNPEVNPQLQAAFENGRVHKEYLALCAGLPEWNQIEITTGHGRSRHGRFRVYPLEEVGAILPNGSRVKHMQTRFVIEQRLDGVTLVRAYPLTGRTHQIRLHLAYLGHSLLGDTKYEGPAEWRGTLFPYHLLHAAKLELPHPRTGEPFVLTAPRPAWSLHHS